MKTLEFGRLETCIIRNGTLHNDGMLQRLHYSLGILIKNSLLVRVTIMDY